MFVRLLTLALVLGWSQAALAVKDGREHVIPLFIADMDPDDRQGFVMVTNHSGRDGDAYIYGTDDAGEEFEPVRLALEAGETQPFNSYDLENGNDGKGLMAGLGDGSGNWRLSIYSTLDIEPLTYVRTGSGFLSAMNDFVAGVARGHRVPIFNPASNTDVVSWLRLINPGANAATVTIAARDQDGADAPVGDVTLTLDPGEAMRVTAQDLERGGSGLSGTLGDGAGKWSLWVSADQPIQVMNLMDTQTGELSNLSGTNASYLGAAGLWQIEFADGNGGQGYLMLLSDGRLYAWLPESEDFVRIARGNYSSYTGTVEGTVEGTGVVYESGEWEVESFSNPEPMAGSDVVTLTADFGAGDWIRGGYTVEGEAQREFHGWAFTGFDRGASPARIQGNWNPLAGHLPASFAPDANGSFSGSYNVTEPIELKCDFDGTMAAVNAAFGAYESSPVVDCTESAPIPPWGGPGKEDQLELFMAVTDAPDKPGEGTRAIVLLIFPREANEVALGAVFDLTR